MLRQFTILALVLACDVPADSPPMTLAEDVAFREAGQPSVLYLQDPEIGREYFTKIVNACSNEVDPPLAVTLSWYRPDLTKDEYVIGLGFSTVGDYSLHACYRTLMNQLGGMPP